MIDLEAIRQRNEERRENPPCRCVGHSFECSPTIEKHERTLADIDALLAEVERLSSNLQAASRYAEATADTVHNAFDAKRALDKLREIIFVGACRRDWPANGFYGSTSPLAMSNFVDQLPPRPKVERVVAWTFGGGPARIHAIADERLLAGDPLVWTTTYVSEAGVSVCFRADSPCGTVRRRRGSEQSDGMAAADTERGCVVRIVGARP